MFNELCKVLVVREGFNPKECPKIITFIKDIELFKKGFNTFLEKDLFCSHYLD